MGVEHEKRRARLAEALSAAELDGVLVSHLLNVRHLTGFTGSAGHALVGADGSCTVATDARYQLQVAEEAPDLEAVITRQGQQDLAARAEGRGWTAVGYEDLHLSVRDWRELTGDADGTRWHPCGRLIPRMRGLRRAARPSRPFRSRTAHRAPQKRRCSRVRASHAGCYAVLPTAVRSMQGHS